MYIIVSRFHQLARQIVSPETCNGDGGEYGDGRGGNGCFLRVLRTGN